MKNYVNAVTLRYLSILMTQHNEERDPVLEDELMVTYDDYIQGTLEITAARNDLLTTITTSELKYIKRCCGLLLRFTNREYTLKHKAEILPQLMLMFNVTSDCSLTITLNFENKFRKLFEPLEGWSDSWITINTVSLIKHYLETGEGLDQFKDTLMDAGCEDELLMWFCDNDIGWYDGIWFIEKLTN